MTQPVVPADRTRLPATDVPDAVAPPPRHPRFPLMDGVRAIAVLAVVVVHAVFATRAFSPSLGGRLLAHLNVGVAVFFVISGFLLYRPFIAHRLDGPPAPDVRDYARRRILRIYPAYWLVVTVLVLVPTVGRLESDNWIAMYALLDWFGLFGREGCLTCGLAQTWSLGTEVTFYASLPFYAGAMMRLTRRLDATRWARAEFAVLASASGASVALTFGAAGDPPMWFSRSVLGYILWFALGMAMAVASVRLHDPSNRPSTLVRVVRARPAVPWLMGVAAYVGLALWLPPNPFFLTREELLVTHLVFGIVAALVVAPAVFAGDAGGVPGRVLAARVVAWMGLVSYGVFLWHYVVAFELSQTEAGSSFGVNLVATLAIATAFAALSYYALERPVLRLKDRRIFDTLRAGLRRG